jgi:hypothetical protein
MSILHSSNPVGFFSRDKFYFVRILLYRNSMSIVHIKATVGDFYGISATTDSVKVKSSGDDLFYSI